MSAVPHSTLLAILREITKPLAPIAKCLMALRTELPSEIVDDVTDIMFSRDIVLAVVRDRAKSVWSKNNYGRERLSITYGGGFIIRDEENNEQHIEGDQLHSLVREAWLGKGDGNATT